MKQEKLIAARERMQWTIEEAAQRLGVDAEVLRKWEDGVADVPFSKMRKLGKLYNSSLIDLGLAKEYVPEDADARWIADVKQAPDVVVISDFQMEDLTLRLQRIIWKWDRSCRQYALLQASITREIEEHSKMNQQPHHLISRRNALRRIVIGTIEFCGLSMLGPVLRRPVEEILTQCAAGIAACWQLKLGKDLNFALRAVSSYIPTLKAIAASPSRCHYSASDMLIQALFLQSALVRHVESIQPAISIARRAEEYSEETDNRLFQLLAVRMQAAAYYYGNQWQQALEAGEKARYLLEDADGPPMSQLVRSYVYAGLATYQAREGLEQEALRSMEEASTAFYAQPTNEPPLIYADHSEENLILQRGLTYLHIGSSEKAVDAFKQAITSSAGSEMGRVEALIARAMIEASREDKPGDKDQSIDAWTQGIDGAIALQSEQRYNEGIITYAAMCGTWRTEKDVRDLREHIRHW
jgi:tetratricopeptide (TPR) repeat protein/DNA-binding XRE family transcriptional regulator